MRSRWGSYSPKGMSLNLLFIMAPIECLDYVILHELCHHKVRGHGRRFWALMKGLMPECMERKRQLNEYSAVLHLFSS